jgi:DNA primase
VEEFEGLDFKGALKLLAGKAGVHLENFNPKEESEKERLYRVMEEATGFFEKNLEKNFEVITYLKTRGLNDESIKNFRIGFVPEEWRLLHSHLTQIGWKDNDIEKAGLAKKTEKGMYDRFRNRIVFPISDSSGRVIAFSGRLFKDDGKSAKYLNSPDTPIFNKSLVLFGLDKAKESIRKNNFSILVEGQMDLVLSHQAGYKNTVATSGTALSDATVSKENVVSNLGLVRRLSENIVLAFDGDKAGFSASLRAGKIALSLGMDVKVANLPQGVDPADLISKDGNDAWRSAIRGSKHLIEFFLDKVLLDASGDNRKAGREIKEKVLPFVNSIESSIEQMHFIKKISDMSSIPEQALKDDLKKIEQELKFEKNEIKEIKNTSSAISKKDYIEKKLLGIIVWQKGLGESEIDTDKILRDLSTISKQNEDYFLEKTKNNKEDLIFEAEVFYGGGIDLKKDINELLLNLEEEYLNEDLAKKMQELHRHSQNKNPEKEREVMEELKEINNKIQNIKNSRLNNKFI